MKTRINELTGTAERWCPCHNDGEGAWLDASLFHKGPSTSRCRGCRSKEHAVRYDARQATLRNYLAYHETQYEAFYRLFQLQEGRCALCGCTPGMRKVGNKREIPALSVELRCGQPYSLLCDSCFAAVLPLQKGMFTLKGLIAHMEGV